ncbi:hypothetical protein [Polyangium sp. y55x31]|uniref:hypothetical protein n=1 Tax=Polyangium sp. y55x31 TaxID=3042688 RepID=UPI002482A0D1|nr:hypothetical protein [Polyangium sp. y55x31]MDI1476364.1 hypothetical protein [Polyangium sp. y55x31]
MPAAFVTAALVAGSAHASAGDAPSATKPPPSALPAAPKEGKWYGWQTLIVGGASTAFFWGGLALDGTPGVLMAPIGLAGMALGAPIIHWAHGYVGKGFRSMGLDVGMFIGGAIFGIFAVNPLLVQLGVGENQVATMFPPTFAYSLAIGTGLGYLGATAIDAAVFSRVEVEAKPSVTKSSLPLPTSLAIIPAVDQNRFGLSLVGQF